MKIARKMPKNAEWMDGEEAIAHIRKALNCSRERAIAELQKAIESGRLRARVAPHLRH
jgi:hypothetical protein